MNKSESDIRDEFFSDVVCWQSWLDVESALALAQGEIGIIPKWAAKNISDSANVSNININFLQDEITKTGTEVFSLTRAFSSICGDAGDYVHWGATTQNIVETGQLLVLKKYHIDLMQTISLVIGKLSLIAKNHSNTIMVGRTLSRHALPITYGFKVAGWIENFIELAEQIMEVEKRLFKMRFGGAVGAFHSFGDKGKQLTELLAQKLGLGLAIERIIPGSPAPDPKSHKIWSFLKSINFIIWAESKICLLQTSFSVALLIKLYFLLKISNTLIYLPILSIFS